MEERDQMKKAGNGGSNYFADTDADAVRIQIMSCTAPSMQIITLEFLHCHVIQDKNVSAPEYCLLPGPNPVKGCPKMPLRA
jgi:hypothetical protein